MAHGSSKAFWMTMTQITRPRHRSPTLCSSQVRRLGEVIEELPKARKMLLDPSDLLTRRPVQIS